MPEAVADIAPPLPKPLAEKPPGLTLKEAQVLRRIEKGFEREDQIPPIRKERAGMMDVQIEEHIKQLVDKTPPGQQEAIRQKASEVREYFTTYDKEIGMTPFERIVKIYEHLEVPTNPDYKKTFDESLKAHMSELGRRAFDQHLENPEQYVSHGFDHSIRVADYSMKILENFPDIVDQISEMYKISPGNAKFIAENSALFHDCGYCALARGSSKVAHSVGSLRIIGDKDLQVHMRNLMSSGGAELKGMMFHKLMYDLEGSILFHNSDVLERKYDTKLITSTGEWLGLADEKDIIEVITHWEEYSGATQERSWFKLPDVVVNVKSEETKKRIEERLKEVYLARGFDPDELPKVYLDASDTSSPVPDSLLYSGRMTDLKPGDKRIGVEYQESDTLRYSLLALLRVSDNLDLLPDRFSQIQRFPAFQQIYRDYFGREDLGNAGVKEGIIAKVLGSYQDLSPVEKAKLQQLGLLLDGESFKHFGGCEALRSVAVRTNPDDPSQAEIAVHVDSKSFQELQKIPFTVKAKVGDSIQNIDMNVAEFQLWRLSETVKVNFHGGKPINIRILDENGVDLTQSAFLHTGAEKPGP